MDDYVHSNSSTNKHEIKYISRPQALYSILHHAVPVMSIVFVPGDTLLNLTAHALVTSLAGWLADWLVIYYTGWPFPRLIRGWIKENVIVKGGLLRLVYILFGPHSP